ncbi:hypothetical protein B0H16DRAFT_1450446 [Mycena metata]|uniref:Uncharacterized protein n=1 Tax=Mycena metata TaxID=1033252 RepID=A0AAD7JZF3_9AGAR|nr:hypothetical protein B0H16DRAFT_1450446 [Mycena metata]
MAINKAINVCDKLNNWDVLTDSKLNLSWLSRRLEQIHLLPLIIDTRLLLGEIGVDHGKGKGKGAKARKEKENVEVEDEDGEGGLHKAQYTVEGLIHLARAVDTIQPFLAPQGRKGQAWDNVVDIMKTKKEFPDTILSAASAQHKAKALVKFKKDPSKNTQLNNLIDEGTGPAITMGALLEKLETQWDSAKGKSDNGKAKIKQKNDKDCVGGSAFREASMRKFRKRRCEPTPEPTPVSDNDGRVTDGGVAPSPSPTPAAPTPSRAVATSSSIETIDSDNDDMAPKRKRRRHNSSADTGERILTITRLRRMRHCHEGQIVVT